MDRFAVPKTYAVWSKDQDIRYCSTSGGAFTEFAKAIIADGGLVAGAKYNDENLVEHDLIDSYEGIEKLRQSKYMSSSMYMKRILLRFLMEIRCLRHLQLYRKKDTTSLLTWII